MTRVEAKPSCAGCDCGVPVRNGMHEEPTDIPDTVYVYPCRAVPVPARGEPEPDCEEPW